MSTHDTAAVQVPVFPAEAASTPRPVSIPAIPPRPIPHPPVPKHPWMAANGRSNMHNDAYMSDGYGWPGPSGDALEIRLGALDGLCATLTFDRLGRIVTVCSGIRIGVTRELLRLDPHTLEADARYRLPSGGGGSSGFGGGGYIYLDNLDRPVVPTADQRVMIFEAHPPTFEAVASYDLSAAIGDPEASIQSALPDWQARIWWVTDVGLVGYVDPDSGEIRTYALPTGERIGNSFAVDETGGVFIVSDHAQYRFDVAPDGAIVVTWREAYDRGTHMKPGQVNFGSGTTPTLIGPSWLGITDNADPRMHVLVYHREAAYPGSRLAAQVPVFLPGYSDTENSLIAAGESFIVENNYGYTGTFTSPTGPVAPGMSRVAWPAYPGETLWSTDRVVVPSVVSKVSWADGRVYTYTLRERGETQDWFVTAVDAHTGAVLWEVYAGSGLSFDNHYAGLFVGPDGSVYVPVWSGIVRLGPV